MSTLSQVQLLYQLTPIWLRDGIASGVIGGYLPILALINTEIFNALMPQQQMGPEGSNLPDDWSFENAFAIFQPAPGGSLISQSIAEYPFASLNVASNATLRNPLNISLVMMTPMKTQHAWTVKQSRMTSLKFALDNHNNLGGSYVVFTPAFIYNNMLLENLTDASTAQSPLPQNTWRWDFTAPLISLEDVVAAENNLISKITNGLPNAAQITAIQTALGISSIGNMGIGVTVPPISGTPVVSTPTPMITPPFSQGGGIFSSATAANIQSAINRFNNP